VRRGKREGAEDAIGAPSAPCLLPRASRLGGGAPRLSTAPRGLVLRERQCSFTCRDRRPPTRRRRRPTPKQDSAPSRNKQPKKNEKRTAPPPLRPRPPRLPRFFAMAWPASRSCRSRAAKFTWCPVFFKERERGPGGGLSERKTREQKRNRSHLGTHTPSHQAPRPVPRSRGPHTTHSHVCPPRYPL